MDYIHESDWSTFKFGRSLSKTRNASFSCSSSENFSRTFNKINNFGSIIDVSSKVRSKVLSDITLSILNTNNRQISHKHESNNSEIIINSSNACNQKTSEEKFTVCGETQNSRLPPIILSDIFNNESSSSPSTSNGSSSFSEDDTLLKLISQGSFSIDPQKRRSHETDLLLNANYGSSNYKLPCNSSLRKNNQDVKRKLEFSSNLSTKFKRTTTQTNLIRNKIDSKMIVNQSFITDYFNIKKFSQNESLNSPTLINSLTLSNLEEPTKCEHLNLSNDNINLISINNEQMCKSDASFESEQSSEDNNQSKLSDSEKKLSRKMLEISKKTSLIYTGPKVVFDDQKKKNKNFQIIAKIETIFLNFLSSLRDDGEYNNLSHTETMQNNICEPHLTIKFGKKSTQRSSTLKMFLLGKIYSLICHNEHCSQRQVYYELKKYVKSQSIVEYSLFSICLLLNVEPWYLPINTTGAGLVFGNLIIITSNNIIINCLNFGGTLIPQDVLQIKEFKSDANFILIVEKDAIFQKLLDEDICKSLATSCIVITGKGFPDYNTRLFSKLLWQHLRIPIFVLTDGDPYGVEIMLTYRFGSTRRPHFLEDITIPEIQWIGILPSDIEKLSIPYEELNQADISKVKKMLERPYVSKYDWLKRELNCMLKCNKKAGIEGVLDNYRSLTKFYLNCKFFSTDFC